MTTPGNSERDVARSSTPATDAEMSEATTDGATPAPHEPTENTPQDSAQGGVDTDPNNDTSVERENTNADTAASPVADDSPEATDEDGTEAEQGPEELDEDDRSWRENLA